jgi:hypothetical protein
MRAAFASVGRVRLDGFASLGLRRWLIARSRQRRQQRETSLAVAKKHGYGLFFILGRTNTKKNQAAAILRAP